MTKLGLALSGGGFRATLYHLGVVKFLKEVGLLQNVSDIASVSGGSILAAHLVLNWEQYNGDDASFNEAVSEILKFVQFDLRNHILRRLPLQFPFRLLAKLPLLDSRKFTPNAILEHYYEKFLYGDRCLYELPEKPLLHILATSVSIGKLAIFNRNGLFLQQRGEDSRSFTHIKGQMASIPRIVGASSAFPGFFAPVQITAADLGVPEGQFPTEYFTDGGVCDNLGVRAFLWLREQGVEFDHILVSDAGKPFQILTKASLGILEQSVRASDILWDRVWQLELENFGQQEGFSFFPVTEMVDQLDDPTAQKLIIQTEVQTIRTDLDSFSDQEINALVQHGYEVARKLCRQKDILGGIQTPNVPPWKPIPTKHMAEQKSPIKLSHGGPADETQLARQLRKSSLRRFWSTFFDLRDWPSYLYLAIAFVLFFYFPLQVYKLYRKSEVQAEVISSIANGNSDIKKILELSTSDPTSNWVSEEIGEKPQRTLAKNEGIEVINHSRFYDLRRWHPEKEEIDQKGKIYIFDQIVLKFVESYKGDHRFTLSIPTFLEDIEFRKSTGDLKRKISRVKEPFEFGGRKTTVYEFDYDLSQVLPEETVDIQTEVIARDPRKTTSIPIILHLKTDVVTVWILFPPERPYKTYSLVSYPVDRSSPPRIMRKSYVIHHPYGYLIGWSVVNPEINRVYECRWTY